MSEAPTEASRARLERERNLWIATVRAGGRPHMVPVWFVMEEGKLYVCIEPRSVKGRNLAVHSEVCVALEDGSHPVICEGRARALGKPWPPDVVAGFRSKYEWDILQEQRYTQLVEILPRKWLEW